METQVYFKTRLNGRGNINCLFRGRFAELYLNEMSDEDLQWLYENGNEYVYPTLAGQKKFYPDTIISAKPLRIKK